MARRDGRRWWKMLGSDGGRRGRRRRSSSTKSTLSLSICSFFSDLLTQLEPSAMAKGAEDVAPPNEATAATPRIKSNKPKSSKISQSTSRLSNLFSKISGKDKKAANNYYMSAKAPFTSTPDMSAEEDGPFGVEVPYVETESEDNNSEGTIPVADATRIHETAPVRSRYVNGTMMDDSSSLDYSSSSVSGNNNTNAGGQMRQNDSSWASAVQQVVQPRRKAMPSTDQNSNVVQQAESRSRMILKKSRHVAVVAAELFLALFILFWSIVVAKMLYDDFYGERWEPSAICSGVQAIDAWLPLGLAKVISCNDVSSSLFGRLQYEAEVVITFVLEQFHFIPAIWSYLTTTLSEFYEEWLPEAWEDAKETVEEYYEIVSISLYDLVEKCIDLFIQVYLISKGFTIELYENTLYYLGLKANDDYW